MSILIVHITMSQKDIVDYPEDSIVINTGYIETEKERALVIENAIKVEKENPGKTIVIQTWCVTSNSTSPCGCYPYGDYVCDYHCNFDGASIAKCLCSEKYGMRCSYH